MSNTEKLVIKALNKPAKGGQDELLGWFCEVFDLAGKNDDAMEPEMLKQIAERSINGEGITSKDLNRRLETPRSTVIYHLNRFIYSGLVVRKGRRYYLRSNDMASTLEEMQAEMEREFNRMIEFAERLDKMLESEAYGRKRKEREQ